MKRLLAMLLSLALCLCALPALADDVCVLDAASAGAVTTDRSYVRVVCADAQGRVTVSVRSEDGSLIYEKDHGECSGAFRSDEIYLPLNSSRAAYALTLTAGQQVYDFAVVRCLPRMTGAAACSAGVPMAQITGSASRQSVTVIDMQAMDGMSISVPMHAGSLYTLGSVTFSVKDGKLTVSASLDSSAQAVLDSARVLVAVNALEAEQLESRSFSGITGTLNDPIDLHGEPYAIVYVKLAVSFDPGSAAPADAAVSNDQQSLWQLIDRTTINEALG